MESSSDVCRLYMVIWKEFENNLNYCNTVIVSYACRLSLLAHWREGEYNYSGIWGVLDLDLWQIPEKGEHKARERYAYNFFECSYYCMHSWFALGMRTWNISKTLNNHYTNRPLFTKGKSYLCHVENNFRN